MCEAPLGWIAPNVVAGPGAPARGRFALRASAFLRAPRVEVAQGERVLWRGRPARVMPGRSARLPHAWTGQVDAEGPAVRVGLGA